MDLCPLGIPVGRERSGKRVPGTVYDGPGAVSGTVYDGEGPFPGALYDAPGVSPGVVGEAFDFGHGFRDFRLGDEGDVDLCLLGVAVGRGGRGKRLRWVVATMVLRLD